MKVLHVITGLGIGGAELQLRQLLRRLPVAAEVMALTNPGPVADQLRADGVPVSHLGMRSNRDLSALPRLAWAMRTGGYDVVHTHLYRACLYGRIAARLAGVPAVVATEHSLGATQMEGRPLTFGTRALYRATERLGSGTVAVSATVERRLGAWGVPADRIHLVPNGIDPEAFRFRAESRAAVRARLGIPEGAFVVGGVGRQVPGKNFDSLIRAVAAQPGIHLLLAGDGPERVPLLRLIHDLGVADRVHVSAPVDGGEELGLLHAAMDLFVSLCAEESFGLAVVEALAAGLPVRYVACPAVEDLPPEDAPGARRITLAELPGVLREERAAGPRRLPVPAAVERYHIARTAEQVMALYETALHGRRKAVSVPGQLTAAAAGVAAAAGTNAPVLPAPGPPNPARPMPVRQTPARHTPAPRPAAPASADAQPVEK